MKKLVVALLVGTIWFSSGMQVDAAGPKDAGKAKHHTEQTITHVANESIDNGVALGAHKFEDPAKALKDDKKADKHSLEADKKNKKDKEDKKAKDNKKDKNDKNPSVKPGKKPNQNQKPEVNEPALGTTETTMLTDGGWYVSEFDANGVMTKRTFYYANGEMERYFTCQYDENGQVIREDYYDAQGVLTTYSQIEYLNDGTLVVTTMHNADGTIAVNRFDNVGRTHDLICYYADGSFASWCQWNVDENGAYYDYREFNEDGSLLQEYELIVDENGDSVFVPEGGWDNGGSDTGYTGIDEYVNADGSKVVYEFVNGLWVKSSFYNAAGELTDYTVFVYDEYNREIAHITYDANGNMTGRGDNVLDENGTIVETKYVNANGFVTINRYDYVNGLHIIICYDADGSFVSHDAYVWGENHEYVKGYSYDEAGLIISEYDMVKDADGNYTIVPVSGESEDNGAGEVAFTGITESVNADGSKVVYEYENGALLKSSFYNAAGELTGYTTFEYDECYREIGHATYDANGNITSYAENTLDAEGRIIAITSVDNAGFITTNMYDYTNGLHIVICYDAEGRFLSNDTYVWGENHDYVEAWSCDAAGNIIAKYDMIKDADGNYTMVPKEA